jgi:hypothetical protein
MRKMNAYMCAAPWCIVSFDHLNKLIPLKAKRMHTKTHTTKNNRSNINAFRRFLSGSSPAFGTKQQPLVCAGGFAMPICESRAAPVIQSP